MSYYVDFLKEELKTKSVNEILEQVEIALRKVEAEIEKEEALVAARDMMVEAALKYMVAAGAMDSYTTDDVKALTEAYKIWERDVAKTEVKSKERPRTDDDAIAQFLGSLK